MSRTVNKMDKMIRGCIDEIIDGTLLAIDPASISMGYAIYKAGELEISGEIKGKGMPHERLHQIADQLIALEAPDVLAIELIRKNTTLIWSVGTTIASVRSPHLIEVPLSIWHSLREDDYVKTDQLDAELIGRSVVERAKLLRSFE